MMQTSTETRQRSRGSGGGGHQHQQHQQHQQPPRASLMEMVRVEQSLQLKQLEAHQEFQEQKNLLESAERELEAAKAALQRLQQTNAADWAHVQELNDQVAALLKKNEEERKTVSRLKQVLAIAKAEQRRKEEAHAAESNALRASMTTLREEAKEKTAAVCDALRIDPADARLVTSTAAGLYQVMCDEESVAAEEQRATELENTLLGLKETLAKLQEEEGAQPMDEDKDDGSDGGGDEESELAALKQDLKREKAKLKALKREEKALRGVMPAEGAGSAGGQGNGGKQGKKRRARQVQQQPQASTPPPPQQQQQQQQQQGGEEVVGQENEGATPE